MVVVEAEVIPYALPFAEPYVTARGSLTRREMVLLRVRTDDGLVGFGEGVPLMLRGGVPLEDVVEQLERFADYIVDLRGWPAADPGGTPQAETPLLSEPAACAVLTAQLDLEAKVRGVPAWQILGAASVEPVECNATLTLGEPNAVAENAAAWATEGFRSFKLKAASPEDAEAVRAVRDELGPDVRLRVDANGVWDVATAERFLAEVEPAGLELLEQPVPTLVEMAKLRKSTAVPIAADESVAGLEDVTRAIELEACDMATLKLSKVGGHLDAIAIAERLPVYLSSALDGPVGIAAAGHTAQALRSRGLDARVAHGLATQRLFSETVASVACELRDGHLHVPEGPGLGVEIDDSALERHRL